MSDHVFDQIVLVFRHNAAQQTRKFRVKEFLVRMRERVLLCNGLNRRTRLCDACLRQLHLILMLRGRREGRKEDLMGVEQVLA